MQKIPIALAKGGMVLAKPVLRDNGMVLVAEGAELSDSLLERLGNMGVESLTVQGNPVDMDGVGGGTRFAERIERMDHLFRLYKADPWMMKVKAMMVNYFQVKAAAEAAAKAAALEAEKAAENGAEDSDESGEGA